MKLLAIVMGLCLFLVALFHIYWVFGGRRGRANAIPTIEGNQIFTPRAPAILVVAAGILFFASLPLFLAGLLITPAWFASYLNITGFTAAGIFLLRAMGDFKLAGFSKRIKDSSFAVWDSRLYSPLCLFLGLGYAYLSWMR